MKNSLLSFLVLWLCSVESSAQLIEFDKSDYKLNDQVKVKLKFIDPATSLNSIQVFSDLIPADNKIVISKDGWTTIGKINNVGIYNFRFHFAKDTSRYFQLAILSPNSKNFNRLTERIPLLVNIKSEDLVKSFTGLKSEFEKLNKSNWPQLADSTKNSAWLIAYKAYPTDQDHFHLIAGAYCLLDNEQDGARHVQAILAKCSSSVNEAYAVASQVLIATPSLVKPAQNKKAEKDSNIAPFLSTLTKKAMGDEGKEKIRFFYAISSLTMTAIYAIGIN